MAAVLGTVHVRSPKSKSHNKSDEWVAPIKRGSILEFHVLGAADSMTKDEAQAAAEALLAKPVEKVVHLSTTEKLANLMADVAL